MSNSDFMIDEFRHEAMDLFADAENSLLEIDKGGDFEDNFNKIFRCFHSLKGAAGMFGIIDLQNHMHKLENQFEELKSDGKLSSEGIDYFLSGIDVAKGYLDGEQISFEYRNFKDNTVEIVESPKRSEVESIKKLNIGQSGNPVIYAVDDETEILEILEEILTSANYEVHTFTKAQDLLDNLTESKPELVISDINMPEMSGLEMVRRISEHDSDLPVCFLSGFITKEILMEALSYGAYSFIEKPFKTERVLTVVKNAVGRYMAFKLLNKSINYIMYQFPDLDNFLKSSGKENVRSMLKEDLEKILEAKKALYEHSNRKSS